MTRLANGTEKTSLAVALWIATGTALAGVAAAGIGTPRASLADRCETTARRPTHSQRSPTLFVGWHDEMNAPGAWRPLGAGIEPDVFAAHPGALTLRLPHVPAEFPFSYQWGGLTREATVDLGRYPVLAACVRRVQEGSYAHLNVQERSYTGRPVRSLRSPTLHQPGLVVLDIGKAWGPRVRRIQLQLIVGGALAGASCEYAWVRFVRREDVSRLQARPAPYRIELRP